MSQTRLPTLSYNLKQQHTKPTHIFSILTAMIITYRHEHKWNHLMKKSLLIFLLLSGCASQGIDRNDKNQMVKRYYATVGSMQQVTLSSEVGTGIAAGAGFGFVDNLDGNTEEMVGGAIIGGLVGGLFTALFEGGNTAYQYNLYAANEGDFTVIQKHKLDKNTQCVVVNAGGKVTLEPVDNAYCEPSLSTNEKASIAK